MTTQSRKAVNEMGKQKYDVLIDNTIIATDMQLNYATILVEGIFERYYADNTLSVTIRRTQQTEDGAE